MKFARPQLQLSRTVSAAASVLARQHQQQQQRCMGHTVRIIVREDLPHGKAYKDEVIPVKAGYARNFLIPKKMAVYASRDKFKSLGMSDPDQETYEQRQARLQREASANDKDLRAADLLRNYLRSKVLKIWRNVDANSPDGRAIAPGIVNQQHIREKMAKQLKIVLFRREKVHIRPEPVIHSVLTEKETETFLEEMPDENLPCETSIRSLGEYLARITLRGGYKIPLKIEVLKR